jgi:hypothetical protein
MIEVENAKLVEAEHLAAICSLIFKLQRIYGNIAADVFENVMRRSAICVSSGGNGEGWSMLTTLRRDLQQAVDRQEPVSWLSGLEHDDRCQDLLKEVWGRLIQLREKIDQAEERVRLDVIEAINEALHAAWDWKWGEVELALIAVCRQLRIACDCPYEIVEERLNWLGSNESDLADSVRDGSMSLTAAFCSMGRTAKLA